MGTQPEPAVVEVPLLRLSQEAASGSQPSQTPSKGKAESSSEPSPRSPSKPKEDKKKLSEKSGGIIGTITFSHDRVYLADHLRSVLGYWKGERAPQGVGPADTKRCEWCEFEEGCEWR
jgi:exonuclease V